MSLDFTLESLVSNTDDNLAPIATAAFFGYLANILINSRPRIRKKLEDYPGCGQRLADPALFGFVQDDECTWDCQWVDAPFITDPNFVGRSNNRQAACTPGGLGVLDCENDDTSKASHLKNDDLNIYFVFNLLKLPKDLSCLDDCGFTFHKFWEKSCIYENGMYITLEKTNDVTDVTTNITTSVTTDVDVHGDSRDFYNCYMEKRKLSKTEFKFIDFGDRSDYHVTRDWQDVIFEICYLAFRLKDRIKLAGGDFGENYKFCEDIKDVYASQGYNGYVSENESIIPNTLVDPARIVKEKKKVSGKRKLNGKEKENGKEKVNRKRKRNGKRKLNGKEKINGKGKGNGKRKLNGEKKVNGKEKVNSKNKSNKKKYNGKRNKKGNNKNKTRAPVLDTGAGDRLGGPLGNINLESQQFTTGYPWQCSLRTTGFWGQHKCGVTLLSGPPNDTILVGAAHCNYVCRNQMDEVLEMCCCHGNNKLNGCQSKSSYCPGKPELKPAQSQDLQIVCGEHNIGPVPEHISWEQEIVLDIKKIVNHENFKTGEPLDGNDIAVYHVDEVEARAKMKMYPPFQAYLEATLELHFSPYIDSDGIYSNEYLDKDAIYWEKYKEITLRSYGKMMLPACLPKEKYLPDKESSIFSSWKDPKPGYLSPLADFDSFEVFDYDIENQAQASPINPLEDIGDFFNRHGAASSSFDVWPHHARLDKHDCEDPAWMKSNTSYPAGTTCYRDPSAQSCMLFGSSGSGLLRQFDSDQITANQIQIKTPNGNFTLDQINFGNSNWEANDIFYKDVEKYGYVGPLSLYKGCDRAANINYEDVVDTVEDKLTNIDFKDDFAELEPQKWLMMYGGDNVAVFTDAYCYLDWIANQFDMDPPDGWKKPESCLKATGDPTDKDKETCRTATDSTCDFSGRRSLQVKIGAYKTNITMDQCHLLDVGGGYADNINMCVNQEGQLDHCANNCKGVDANSVVAGGIGILVVANSALTSLLAPAAGVATLGVGAVGGQAALMMMNHMRRPPVQSTRQRRPRRCSRPTPTRPCRDAASGRCCRAFVRGGRRRCPRTC